MHKFLNQLFNCLLLLLACSASAFAGSLTLNAPAESDNGSYILRLATEGGRISSPSYNLELYRNIDGGEYKRLMTVPFFNALSQLVNQNGVYGYKVRVVSGGYVGGFSQPVFVRVQSNVPMLAPRVKGREGFINSSELSVSSR